VEGVNDVGRPLLASSEIALWCMSVQIAAIHGYSVLRGQNKEVANCLLLTWYWAREAAAKAEGLYLESKPSR